MPEQQRVIKKYANRKLYDMQDRKYVTQTLVQAMVDAGDNVVIIDKETDADITDTVVRRPAAAHHAGAHHAGAHHARSASSSHKTTASSSNTVRDQVASLIKTSIGLPLEITQIVTERLQSD